MDAIAPPIRMADAHAAPLFRWDNWEVDEVHRFIFYVPAQLMFKIETEPQKVGAYVPLSAFTAHLVHVCDGSAVPAQAELEQLGLSAIIAYCLKTERLIDYADFGDDEVAF